MRQVPIVKLENTHWKRLMSFFYKTVNNEKCFKDLHSSTDLFKKCFVCFNVPAIFSRH